jgi:hypothetical protein
MKKNVLKMLAITAFSIILAGCFNQSEDSKNEQNVQKDTQLYNGPTNYLQLNDSLSKALINQGNSIAQKAGLSLQKALKAAINEGGLEYAIQFCNVEALPITDSVSESESVEIKRLAKKYRNTLNKTDSVESEIYKTYILDWLSGKPLKPSIMADENHHPVYYNPIYVGALCLNCHGEVGTNINPDLAATISKLYPDDKATNFKQGQLRGMWAITFNGIKVN